MSNTYVGPLLVLWQVSFGCWVTWSISNWQKYYKSVFFPKAKWWVAELFLSLNNWGLNFLQNECSQSSQIYLSPEKLRKLFTFQSCKFLNDKIDQSINFANSFSRKFRPQLLRDRKRSSLVYEKEDTLIILSSAWGRSRDSTAKRNLSKDM